MVHSQQGLPLTVSNYVSNFIRDAILSGKLPAGGKIDQRQLAAQLSVSLIPIRESLRQLEAEGFVRIYPRRGAFVAELSIGELQEIYFIRKTLEDLATQLAVPNLSPQALDRLGQFIQQMERATDAHDYAELLRLNREFHFAIYEASGSRLLLQMISGLWDRSSMYRRLYTYLPERAPQALAEHKEIYAACRDGEATRAGRAVRNNVRQTTEGILGKLGPNGSSAESA